MLIRKAKIEMLHCKVCGKPWRFGFSLSLKEQLTTLENKLALFTELNKKMYQSLHLC